MRAVALAFGSLLLCPAIVHAQLVVVPPVVSANAKSWEKNIGAELLKKVDGAKVPRVKLDKAKADRFRACKNTLSCLAEESSALAGTHFLHTIVGRRGSQVKVQFTLVAVASAKPVAQQRMSAAAKKAKVIASIKDGMDVMLAEMAKVPELRPGGKPPEPLAVFTPPPPVAKPEPPPPVAQPEPPPPAAKPEPPPPVEKPEPPVATAEKLEPVPISEPEVRTQPSPGLLVREEAPKPGPNWLAWGTMGGGVALAGAGTIMLVLASSDISARNETPQIEAARRQELTDSAGTKQNLGVLFLLSGGAAIATGAVFHLLGIGADEPADGSSRRAFLIGPTGAYVTF